MAKWKITDSSTGTPVDWVFPVNPNEFKPPGRKATVKAESAIAPTGNVILFQGRDEVTKLSFSGLVNSETFHDELKEQLDKWHTLTLTDDQGSTWDIIIMTYSMKRVRRALNQWRYDYEVTATVVNPASGSAMI